MDKEELQKLEEAKKKLKAALMMNKISLGCVTEKKFEHGKTYLVYTDAVVRQMESFISETYLAAKELMKALHIY